MNPNPTKKHKEAELDGCPPCPRPEMGLSLCPICHREYSQLSQHLKVTHRIFNVEERKQILALESGRVSFREGCCPIPGCSKHTTRLDRHLQSHSELSKKARQDVVALFKKNKIMAQLAALRASNPKPPMASTLDLQEVKAEDPMVVEDLIVQEELCCLESCRREKLRQKSKIADLKKQLHSIAAMLKEVTRRYRALKRRFGRKFSEVASSNAQCSSLQQSFDGQDSGFSRLPKHVAALNEHHKGPDLTLIQGKKVDMKMFRTRNFLVIMEDGNLNLPTVPHTLQGLLMLRPLKKLKLCVAHTRQQGKKSLARKHFVSKSYTLAGLARAKKARAKVKKALKLHRSLSTE